MNGRTVMIAYANEPMIHFCEHGEKILKSIRLFSTSWEKVEVLAVYWIHYGKLPE